MPPKPIHFTPAGLAKKSFALPFQGGMIWFEHLDSLGGDASAFHAKLDADAADLAKASAPSHLAFVLDETDVTQPCCDSLAFVLAHRAHPRKVAFVGASPAEKRRLRASLASADIHFAISFYDDLEEAKRWLLPP